MQTVEKHKFFNQILLEHSFKFHWKKKKHEKYGKTYSPDFYK